MKHIDVSWNMFMSQSFYKGQSKALINLSVLVEISGLHLFSHTS